ncbi:Adenosine deaminase [anaerobic digester metagenome]
MLIIPEYILMPDSSIKSGMAVLTADNGSIIDVMRADDCLRQSKNTYHCCGLLLPGLINSHCHLELSWSRGLYPEQSGMEAFYGAMSGVHSRRPADKVILSDIQHAIDELHRQGVVAVADICNTDISLSSKLKSDICFHTFLEVFGNNEGEARIRFNDLLSLQNVFEEEKQNCSLSAHTLLTLSDTLMSLLMTRIASAGRPHSIHFLESDEENQYFENKRPIKNVHGHNHAASRFNSAFEAAAKSLPPKNRVMFVHNTFADKATIEKILVHFDDPWFCFCPGSNKFITGCLPDVPMINSLTSNILIGTDSLSSNQELNMFAEIDLLLQEFPVLTPETLLTAATLNGARFLGIDGRFGSIEKNKKSGLVLLENYQPGQRTFSSLPVKRLA